MRLVSCYIENFGKWSDRLFSFEPGCNVICQENGWGKSTLAAFVRVMLYGFQDELVRDPYRNERKRYRPWQGGVYGGRLEFEAGGRMYVISRVFGSKGKEDSFSLREKDTNLVSHAYSAAVGEELFQLDASSFQRTVFLSQNDCETWATDGIHAKIGNLAQAADDISNYEKALQKLQDGLNQMTPHRKTGSLSRMKGELGRLEESVRTGRRVSQAMEQVNGRLCQMMQEQERLRKERAELLIQQQKMGAYRDVQAKQERYRGLCQEYAARKEKLVRERAFFPGELPDPGEVDTYLARSARLLAAREAVYLGRITEEEKERIAFLKQIFPDTLPKAQDFLEQEENLRRIREIDLKVAGYHLSRKEAEQLAAYAQRFAAGMPDPAWLDGILADWRRRMELETALEQKKITLEVLKETSQTRQGLGTTRKGEGKRSLLWAGGLAVVGILLLVLGLIGWFAGKQTVPGLVLVLAGMAAVLAGMVWKLHGDREGHLEGSGQAQASAGEYPAWQRMQQEITEEEIFIENVEADTEAFLAEYGLEGSPREEVLDLLYSLKAETGAYRMLQNKSEGLQAKRLEASRKMLVGNVVSFLQAIYGKELPGDLNKASTEELDRLLKETGTYSREYALLVKKQEGFCQAQAGYQGMVSGVQAYVESLQLTPEQDLHAQLLEVRHHRQQIQICEQELAEAGTQKKAFEETESLEQIMGVKPPAGTESLAAINSRLEDLSQLLESGYAAMAEYNRQLEQLREEADQVAEEEADLAAVRRAYEQEQERYALFLHTRSCLEQARVSFLSRYTQPVREGFEKYYAILTGKKPTEYHVDAHANVTVEDLGMQRDPRFLSCGYRDLVGICMRMALVDAMYRKEKPFLILDDPFASLDADKLEGAMGFLEAIGREYQVLYFTCHGSRS